MVKSLYTLRLSSGYNDLLNSENLKVDIGKLCHDIEQCSLSPKMNARQTVSLHLKRRDNCEKMCDMFCVKIF